MRARWLGAAMVATQVASAAAQQAPLPDKACILRAATMLPAIPGLAITAASTREESIPPVLRHQASLIPGRRGFLEFMDGFGVVDKVTEQQLDRLIDGRRSDQIAPFLAEFAVKHVAAPMRVEIAVTAATVSASYAFACAVLKDGSVKVYPQGLSR